MVLLFSRGGGGCAGGRRRVGRLCVIVELS